MTDTGIEILPKLPRTLTLIGGEGGPGSHSDDPLTVR